ncbi:Tubulin-tyrosine ligase family protein [Tritrichomonas foetus]|uniref:Tubulin-tyrosine ligase family protein n=1 Tax=Tritrichomonas foetus TaxID=1144522 RepID=A0A1J4KKR6_9EUKA|nr:Tubulin-tyrosine ligase family protein [Tritrichomonas foetus]|eukprot:OHT11887.1 Tubulin-tyrosine ligase family protein [Tritrichomonas foetus]
MIECDDKLITYETVRESMSEAGVGLTRKDVTCLLVWRDLLSPNINYRILRPWQILNRIPFSNVICLKSPLSVVLNESIFLFPSDYDFVPKTYLLPKEYDKFISDFKETSEKCEDEDEDLFIIKPSNGSLGNGIRLVRKGDIVENSSTQSVAQQYIRSHLINDTKFDLRIYALVVSVDPLEIYVYRNGIARFCSMKSNVKSRYSKLTNVSLNKHFNSKNSAYFSSCSSNENISQLISDVFDEHFSEEEQNYIWKEIDRVILLTLFSGCRYMKKGQDLFIPSYGIYSRCFQILGFDILLHEKDLKAYLVEVNYRPSLDYLRACERRMKIDMIKDSIRISVPHQHYQNLVRDRQWSWSLLLWQREALSHPELVEMSKKMRKKVVSESNYEKIWPRKKSPLFEHYSKILNDLNSLPINCDLVVC